MMNDLLSSIFGNTPLLAMSLGGTMGVLGAALALGIRHGIDWDHIAAITDITSTAAASADETDRGWLNSEPALMLTDESHHLVATARGRATLQTAVAVGGSHSHSIGEFAHRHNGNSAGYGPAIQTFVRRQRPALVLGSMYALGHGSVVVLLGLLAILARQFLPDWIDPIMERIVGATLIMLALYLFFSATSPTPSPHSMSCSPTTRSRRSKHPTARRPPTGSDAGVAPLGSPGDGGGGRPNDTLVPMPDLAIRFDPTFFDDLDRLFATSALLTERRRQRWNSR